MSLEKDIEEHCPLLDERIETFKRSGTAQSKYYVECDLKILSVLNPRLYQKYKTIVDSLKEG
jgi:hypothetical protein